MIKIDMSEIDQKLQSLMDGIDFLTREVASIKQGHNHLEAFSISKVAQKLSCSRGKVRNLFVSGELDGYQEKKGGKIFIYPESVQEYLRNNGL